MNVDSPPIVVSDTTQSLASTSTSGTDMKDDTVELVENNATSVVSSTQPLTSTSTRSSSFTETLSKSLLQQPPPSTSTSQEWPADPNMYQLVVKIGQGAFATVWKAYRVNPSIVTATETPQISTSSSTTTTTTTTSDTSASVSTSALYTDLQQVSSSTAANMTPCAVKVLNLDHADTTNLAEIRLEVQAMRLLSHPNVLPCHTAFVNDRNLWLITPLMEKGSSLHALQSIRKTLRRHRRQLMQQQQQEESNDSTTTPHILSSSLYEAPILPTASSLPMSSVPHQPIRMEQHIMYILHETIVGLQYIHENLQIHRDIKAGNILIDVNGNIKIADFGVSSFLLLTNNGSLYQHEKAKTFVGTPCWMAPEVMEQVNGYDYKADIWSLGITALELAKGYAPYAKYPPMKVLILTIQEEPPSLASYDVETGFSGDDECGDDGNNVMMIETYSPDFEDLVKLCLQKDPTKRPTCAELLASNHFSNFQEIRQQRIHAMRDEICSLVKDVGYKQEERAASMATQQQQQQYPILTSSNNTNYNDAATVMAGNHLKSSIIQQRVAEVEDRPAGTTWVFATEDTMSSTIVGDDATATMVVGLTTTSIDAVETQNNMTNQDTLRRSGSGHLLDSTGDYDDVLAELDEFERQTGGENYARSSMVAQQQQQQYHQQEQLQREQQQFVDTSENINLQHPSSDIVHGELVEQTSNVEMVDDDLDQFMDEFEQNTGGEDFRRRHHHQQE